MLGSIEGCLHQLMRGSTPVKSMSWATYTLSTVPWLMVTVAGRFALRSTAWSARRCMVRAVLLSNGSSTTAPLPSWVVLLGPCFSPAYLQPSLIMLLTRAVSLRLGHFHLSSPGCPAPPRPSPPP